MGDLTTNIRMNDGNSLFVNGKWLGETETKIISWDNPNNCKVVFLIYSDSDIQIFNESDKLNIEIRYYKFGRRDDINNGTRIIKLNNCKIIRKWIPNPTIIFMDNLEVSAFYVYAIGELEIV